jgi:hypothetical protein
MVFKLKYNNLSIIVDKPSLYDIIDYVKNIISYIKDDIYIIDLQSNKYYLIIY